MLYDRAVNDKLVRRALGTGGRRFGYDALEDRVLTLESPARPSEVSFICRR